MYTSGKGLEQIDDQASNQMSCQTNKLRNRVINFYRGISRLPAGDYTMVSSKRRNFWQESKHTESSIHYCSPIPRVEVLITSLMAMQVDSHFERQT